MTSSRFTVLLTGFAIALVAAACGDQVVMFDRILSTGPRSSAETPADDHVQSLPKRDRPDTKLTLVMLDGQQTEVELELFNPAEFPLIFYTPTEVFTRELQPSEEGLRAQLQYKASPTQSSELSEQTYLSVTIPVEDLTIDELRDRILGDTGLIARQQWQIVDRTSVLTYSWAIERIDIQTVIAGQVYLGSIVLGDRDGQLFYTVTHYPQDLSQEFLPLASMVLETIEHRQPSP
jgi:hypothetical protein